MAAKKQPASSATWHPNHITLGDPWQPAGAPMPDPNVPMPVLDEAGGERETRRAQGFGYSDYV